MLKVACFYNRKDVSVSCWNMQPTPILFTVLVLNLKQFFVLLIRPKENFCFGNVKLSFYYIWHIFSGCCTNCIIVLLFIITKCENEVCIFPCCNICTVYFFIKFRIHVTGFVFNKSSYCSVPYLEDKSYLRTSNKLSNSCLIHYKVFSAIREPWYLEIFDKFFHWDSGYQPYTSLL